jgi:hypothetical protein
MNVRLIAAIVVCLAWAGVLHAQTPEETEKKALQRLVSRLPRLDTSSVACPPFDARFEWKATNGGFRADFQYRRPNRLEATMTDSADGSPCMLYRDKSVMIFDPVTPKFLVASDHMLDFGFREGDDGKVGFWANIGFGSEHVQRIRIDLFQVMQAREGLLTNQNSTDSTIRLLQVRGDRRDELELQFSEPPVCVLKTFERDRSEPELSMILTLFPLESPPLFTPTVHEELAKVLPLDLRESPAKIDGVLGMAAGMKTIAELFHSVYSHIALRQPAARDELKLPGFSTPNWEAVAQNKKELGPKLRDLFSMPARSPDDAPLTPTFASEESNSPK